MNLRVLATKARNVSLEALVIEPAEHLIELLAQNESNDRHGKLFKLHWLSQDTAENFRGLGIGQLASGNLQFESDEIFGALESQGYEGTDIVGCDCLIRLVSTDGIH